MPHERTDPRLHQALEDVLHPSLPEDELDRLHEADEETTWFGIGREKRGRPFLTDGGIYQSLMAHSYTQDVVKFPRIVSFVGETNTGKSTLIKMLDELAKYRSNSGDEFSFPSPIVGLRGDAMATSVDVHLYPDRNSFSTPSPVFYADCEGLDAGEGVPRAGRRARRTEIRRYAISGGRVRHLDWANTEERSTRKFIVSELYPRLLYTFSDVVVFVLGNIKTFERALVRLLKWGQVSLETSVNQATLPHAIIAVNMSDIGVSEAWDVCYSTTQLLDAARYSLVKEPYLKDLSRHWRDRGRAIDSVSDLIHCYYSSFNVIRIPAEGRPNLLLSQMDKLRAQIISCCNESYRTKWRARMLSNSDELEIFMHAAFDHFSTDLETPFNFIEVSLKSNPIPKNIGGNILQLAIAMQKENPKMNSARIFVALSNVAASCVLLECVRYRKGLPQDLFSKYKEYFDFTLSEFCAMYSPCLFHNHRGSCANSSLRHMKGHQNDKGRIIAAGPYQSDFIYEDYCDTWVKNLEDCIAALQNELQLERDHTNVEKPDDVLVLRKHGALMAKFYTETKANVFTSHSICVSCFTEISMHALPCGHVLCTPCVKGYGRTVNNLDFNFNCCPLHPEQTQWRRPSIIRFKPDFAGVRLLSLDG
jgi:hypothetical protein